MPATMIQPTDPATAKPATAASAPLGEVRLLGVPVHSVTLDQAATHIVDRALHQSGGWVITPNLDILRRARRDPQFRRLYDQSTLRLADGMPLVWASRLQGTPLPERAAGSDLIFRLAERAAARGASIFLLGGDPGTAERCAEELKSRYRTLIVAGTHCPPMGFERDPDRLRAMLDALRSASPHIVLVALGSPKQERLIETLRREIPDVWYLGIGITFSFVSGDVARAPIWMRRIGLEWLHRLWQEPRRLFRRYVIDGLPFAAWLLASAACVRFRSRA